MKRILLIVVDGCTSRVLEPAVRSGALPVLARLGEAGTLRFDCVSIFPSITPAATAAIVTGRYPRDHGIAGMSWWNPRTRDISYFGDDVATVLDRGLASFVRDFLIGLNEERLRAETLFQDVERAGLSAGCINHLIFRGDVAHRARLPLLLRLWPTVPSSLEIHGPSLLCLGDLVAERPRSDDPDARGGPLNRFGLDDSATADFLRAFATAGELPHFTVAYFADYDFESHDRGPDKAAPVLERVDRLLGRVFEAWGGLDRVLDELCIVLTADHSHSIVAGDDDGAIHLEEVLDGFRFGDPLSGWREEHEVMVCPNLRAVEIFLRDASPDRCRRLCAALLRDSRVDQVIWRDREGGLQFRVETGDRGALRFDVCDAPGDCRDAYGAHWAVDGDLSALDAGVDGSRMIAYGDYPNALERIAAGLDHPRSGRVWATARPGFEFAMSGQSVHRRGGSHGTLHALDSVVPFLVAGAPRGTTLPEHPRIVDAAPLCRRVLDLEAARPPISHARP